MTILQSALRLATAQTNNIFKRDVWAPGLYQVPLIIAGNSLFSSVWAKSMAVGASIKVRYFETTSGNIGEERVDIFEHAELTPALLNPQYGYTTQGTVTPFHNKPVLEVEVTGGACEFGVYATVVDTFASDLDAALKFDQQVFNSLQDKGIPIIGLDETTGLFNIIRTRNGLLGFTTDIGDPFREVAASTIASIDGDKTVLTFTVGSGIDRSISRAVVSTYGHGVATLRFGSEVIAKARTDAGQPNGAIILTPSQPAPSGTTVSLSFSLAETRVIPISLDAMIYGSEVTL